MKPWPCYSLALCLALAACHSNKETADSESTHATAPATEVAATGAPDACSMILLPPHGNTKTDREIIRYQDRIRADKSPFQSIENLGWLYVAKARESFDPGYYKLAEQCAFCLDSHQPQCAEALLLRGHVLQNLHKFKEAEPLALELVAKRGRSFDYGLLGDVLMEQGRLKEAAAAYQKMVDQKPDMQAYARIAYLRWLTGDLSGATQVMQMAVSAASPNAAESAAWVNTRLAILQLQGGDIATANETCDAALDFQKDYAPALLLRGRLLLADGKPDEAADVLQRAEKLNPLPEYQWVLSEALRAAGRETEAAAMEAHLNKDGAAADPRTYALYLATRGESGTTALQLAQNELDTRADVFTHDALAWSFMANGNLVQAQQEMDQALAEGTKDARLYFHATVLAAKTGQPDEAARWFGKAASMMYMLLPSEQKQLQNAAFDLGQAHTSSTAQTDPAFTPGN